jgi:benzoate/toluate 1,2-dioxygenase reductase subunit
MIRNTPGGLMSSWLCQKATPGTPLTFFGPQGSFFLRTIDRPTVLLAGGTGLAPILSMLEALADIGTLQPIHLIYGVTKDDDRVGIARIRALAARLPTMTWAVCVADPETTSPLQGYVTQHINDDHLNAGRCTIYLCGPPPMVEAVRTFLCDRGIDPKHFHYEKFAPSEAA